MGGGDVQAKLLYQARQARGLTFRQVEHKPGERGRIDDGMRERVFQPAPDQPRVERIVAVLDEDRAVCEAQECAPGVLELRRADEHRAVDVMTPPRVWVDRGTAVDQSVEEGECAV